MSRRKKFYRKSEIKNFHRKSEKKFSEKNLPVLFKYQRAAVYIDLKILIYKWNAWVYVIRRNRLGEEIAYEKQRALDRMQRFRELRS